MKEKKFVDKIDAAMKAQLGYDVKCGRIVCDKAEIDRIVCREPLEKFYHVEGEPFARGRCARVRLCRLIADGAKFAAKTVRLTPRYTSDIWHEIGVLHSVTAQCEHVVRLHRVFQSDNDITLILDMASGGELQTVIENEECVQERVAVRVVRQLLLALQALHHRRVAHLDIKPQNILLTGPVETGQVKLCDFGMSRVISNGVELREIMGTADYMAPELLKYNPLSLATDMWSVGVLCYVLLSGCGPFTGTSAQETFCNVISEPLVFPDDLFSGTSATAIDFISRLVVKEPQRRMTVGECLQHEWLRDERLTDIADSIAADVTVSRYSSCSIPRPASVPSAAAMNSSYTPHTTASLSMSASIESVLTPTQVAPVLASSAMSRCPCLKSRASETAATADCGSVATSSTDVYRDGCVFGRRKFSETAESASDAASFKPVNSDNIGVYAAKGLFSIVQC